MKRLRLILSLALVAVTAFASSSCAQAKSAVNLSASKITLNVGKTKTLALKGTKKKVSFKIISGKKVVSIKRGSKNSVRITALKKGEAVIKAALGSKSYKCAVSVSARRSISLSVNGKKFNAVLNSSKAATELYNMLPLTLDMSELNGNEKYHYFDKAFSGSPKTYATINPGDLMLYGGDCLVLFYDTINNSPYEYIKVGRLTDTKALAATLGSGSVKAQFKR